MDRDFVERLKMYPLGIGRRVAGDRWCNSCDSARNDCAIRHVLRDGSSWPSRRQRTPRILTLVDRCEPLAWQLPRLPLSSLTVASAPAFVRLFRAGGMAAVLTGLSIQDRAEPSPMFVIASSAMERSVPDGP